MGNEFKQSLLQKQKNKKKLKKEDQGRLCSRAGILRGGSPDDCSMNLAKLSIVISEDVSRNVRILQPRKNLLKQGKFRELPSDLFHL